MKYTEILNFLKAPFKEKFSLAFALGLPLLLVTPLIFSFFRFIYLQSNNFQIITSNTDLENLLYNWFINQNSILSLSAILGFFLAITLASGFIYVVGNTIVNQHKNIFEFAPINITGKQLILGVLKTISFIFWSIIYSILAIIAIAFFPFLLVKIGSYLPSLFSILLWIIVIITDIILLLWIIINFSVSKFRFIENFKTRVFFQFRENYIYLKQYKKRFFLAWLFCLIFTVIIQTLLRFFYSVIAKTGIIIQMELLNLNVSKPNVIIILGLLLIIGISVYLSLLQMTFFAKCIIWIKQKQFKNEQRNCAKRKQIRKIKK